ncbi:MAG: flagellar filament capping protein FliD [Acidobacteria bacterium]|nr:flagellar filament capping protein FliD [Acidobacteriota bacterium]
MSSPITFSGFNNIDFNLVLNALMQQASQPLTALQDRQKALRSQVSSFETLDANVSTLQSAASSLSSLSSISTLAGLSSDAAVSATVTGGATPGQYSIVVHELARAQVTASATAAPDAGTTIVASGGTLTIGGVDVAIAGDVTLSQLAQAINGTADIPVTAAVIRTGPNAYRLTLTSNLTGAANGFTITNALTGGTGLTFGDADQDGVSGDSPADNAVGASDAAITINNIEVTSTSNSFEELLPGVTVTVSKKDPATTVDLTIAPDSDALASRLDNFVSGFNTVIKFLETQRVSAGQGDAGSIGRDPLSRQLRNTLRAAVTGAYGSGTFTRLAEVGVEFTTNGTLQLNRSRFQEAFDQDPDAVRSLFAGSGGAFQAVQSALDDYSATTGLISGMKDRLTRQITAMDDQIAALQSRLALQRASLQQQFTEADAAMSRLSSQSGSLASLSSSLGGL